MIIVGLTGGIGSGKTTVSKMFRSLGVPVYNSDKEAKRLMKSSKKIKKAVVALFGEKAYDGKRINKTYISDVVFKDKDLLQKLNAVVHPAVKKNFMSWAQNQDAPYVIQEAAILFENGSYRNYDRIILVKAPEDLRIARVKERDGSSEEQILARMKNQWTDSKKDELSDYIIENIDLNKTKFAVKQIHAQLAEISG